MVAIDANVLLRWLLRDDAVLAAKADTAIDASRAHSLLLDRLILAEVSYVLRSYYKLDKPHIAHNLAAALADKHFYVVDRDMVAAALALFTTEKPLSFEDCWLLALRRQGVVESVLTFDQNLAKRATRH